MEELANLSSSSMHTEITINRPRDGLKVTKTNTFYLSKTDRSNATARAPVN